MILNISLSKCLQHFASKLTTESWLNTPRLCLFYLRVSFLGSSIFNISFSLFDDQKGKIADILEANIIFFSPCSVLSSTGQTGPQQPISTMFSEGLNCEPNKWLCVQTSFSFSISYITHYCAFFFIKS